MNKNFGIIDHVIVYSGEHRTYYEVNTKCDICGPQEGLNISVCSLCRIGWGKEIIMEEKQSEFSKLLKEMQELHDKKSHDYASADDPYANYHYAGKGALLFSHSSDDAGFAGRLFEKLYRLANLEKSGKTPLNESVEDTEKDIAVIVTLWMASRRHRRNK